MYDWLCILKLAFQLRDKTIKTKFVFIALSLRQLLPELHWPGGNNMYDKILWFVQTQYDLHVYRQWIVDKTKIILFPCSFPNQRHVWCAMAFCGIVQCLYGNNSYCDNTLLWQIGSKYLPFLPADLPSISHLADRLAGSTLNSQYSCTCGIVFPDSLARLRVCVCACVCHVRTMY